ncbi:sensor histidine kinase [Streptomyces sp. NBC_01260]|uniref:sensor histidine kinase n=1 Tax=unclassified Streptomyces TaxID=2593676 RepID=UPI000F4A4BB4|nr:MULTISPECIES: sensor histidine kinase [unclassified Streptomyces]MCX4770040.1 sensor histidine kinase [Streptomyces sp. NBC_01285]ROQ82591.1 signal transduction histidine kinase [Streptomyces sp. CEV 2-1]RPK44037.1 Sensor histidine kinase DesK [Streptomyces sp. ADI92-24]
MSATPSLPLLKRVPPGLWVAAAWYAGVVFTFLMRARLPGEQEPSVLPGVIFYRWDGLLTQVLAAALLARGCVLLERRPLKSLAMVLGAAALATLSLSVGEIPLAQFLAADVALYFVAATRPRRTGNIALAMALGTLIGFLAVRVVARWNVGTSAELAVALTAVVAWLVGRSVHEARKHDESLAAKAAAQAIIAERLRIAREMHDMVAHSVGIIALQAGAAARVVHTQPDAAREAMSAVETAGRETLSGLRRMLGALRQDGPGLQGPEREAAPLHPAEGLAGLDRLARATTAAGVRVDVRWRGERRPLPPDIDLSAFRIIQESVTNVVRHAATGSCRVSVEYGPEELAIEVADGGRGPGKAADTGFGLAGMRERVALLHGEFTAAPHPEGGFRVTARLPVPQEDAA